MTTYYYRVEERDGLFYAMKGQQAASRGYKTRAAAAGAVTRIHRADQEEAFTDAAERAFEIQYGSR